MLLLLLSFFSYSLQCYAAADDGYTPQYLTGHLDFSSGEGTTQGGSVDGIKCYLYFTDNSIDYNGYVSLGDSRFHSSNSSNASKQVKRVVLIPTKSWYYLAKGSRYGLFCNILNTSSDQITTNFSFFTDKWTNPYDRLESQASALIMVPTADISLYGSFYQLDIKPTRLDQLLLDYFSVQLMPGSYTQGESMDIIGKLEEGQQEAQQQHEETKGLLGTIIDGILSLPQKIMDLLSNLLKALFVPDDTFIQNWVTDLRAWFEDKFGILALPVSLLTTLIGAFSSAGSGDVSLIFPGFRLMGYEVWSDQTVDLAAILQPFSVIVSAIRMVLGIVLLGAFVKYLQNLYDRVLGAGGG